MAMCAFSKFVAYCFLFMAGLVISVDVKAEDLSSIQECLILQGFYLGAGGRKPWPTY
jgi:hypothetical protein